MTVEVDLTEPVNRLAGAHPVLEAGAPVPWPDPACAYPGGDLTPLGPPYQVDDHRVTWSLPDGHDGRVDLEVHWQGVWYAVDGEVYGCIDGATVAVVAADGTPTVVARFGTPAFTAATAVGDGGWATWAATLPVEVTVGDGDGRAAVTAGWLLGAAGQSHPLS